MFLRCAVHDDPKKWRKWLPLAELWYNSTYRSAIGCSPFKAVYGTEPNFAAIPILEEDGDSEAMGILADRQIQLDRIKKHLAAA